MSDYLRQPQQDVLLQPIRPSRVSQTPRGMSHVEAYEIRAHLNRVFGFARWSSDVLDQQLVYETSETRTKDGKEYAAWSVCYRSILRLTICAKNGVVLATYTEGATGDATNQPSRPDAHDNALKTSESQALKRCAMNLGDQFGLSLYKKGSVAPLVKELVPDVWPEEGQRDPSAHITETPAENDTVSRSEPEREINDPDGPRVEEPEPDPEEFERFMEAVLAGPDNLEQANHFYARALAEAMKKQWLRVKVHNRDGREVTLKALIDSELTAANRKRRPA